MSSGPNHSRSYPEGGDRSGDPLAKGGSLANSSLPSATGFRTPRDLLLEQRTHSLREALRRDDRYGPISGYGFCKEIARRTVRDGFDEAAWQTYVSILSSLSSPNYGVVRGLEAGLAVLIDRGSTPAVKPQEWRSVSTLVLALDEDGVKDLSRIVHRLPMVLCDLAELSVSPEEARSLAHIASCALQIKRSPSSVCFDLASFAAHAVVLTPRERMVVLNTMEERMEEGWDDGAPLVSFFDVLHIGLSRVDAYGGDHRCVAKKIEVMHSLQTKGSGTVPSSTTLEAILGIAVAACQICADRKINSDRVLNDLVELLFHARSSKVSLSLLSDLLLPEIRRGRLDVRSVVGAFSPAGDDPAALRAQAYAVHSAIQAGGPVEPFLSEGLLRLVANKQRAPLVATYLSLFGNREVVAHPCLRNEYLVGPATEFIAEVIEEADRQSLTEKSLLGFVNNYLDILDYSRSQIGANKTGQDVMPYLHDTVSDLLSMNAPLSTLSQIARALRVDHDYSVEVLNSNLCDIRCHWALFKKVQGAEPDVEKVASRVLSQEYSHDSVPYKLGSHPPETADPRALKAHVEIQTLLWRLMNPQKGFSAWTMESRRIPGNPHSALVEFGLDTARGVGYLNSASVDEFPGNAFYFDGLRLDRFLTPDESHDDPYHAYRSAWSFASHIEDVGDTRFVLGRGFIAVSGPDNYRYRLPAAQAHSTDPVAEHYSLVIFNDHFHNPSCEVACGVPTRILEHLLSNTRIPADKYRGFDPTLPSITGRSLSYSGLRDACDAESTNFLDLGWPSNLGGFCNAYPVGSSPFHEWERKWVGGPYKDRVSHIHKAFILSGYSSVLTVHHEQALEPLRELHTKVFNFGMSCLDLLDCFKIAHSLWHKGQTLAREGSLGEVPLSSVEEDQGAPNRIESEEATLSPEGQIVLGPYSTRRLREIYMWHQLTKQEGVNLDRLPIFRVSAAMNLWPETFPIEIDTATLVLKTPRFEIQLPLNSDGHGAEEREIWRDYVMRYAGSQYDFRFWNRSSN